MAHKPTSRRSKSTRKPVTLDLKASEIAAEPKPAATVPEPEPVALESGRETAAGTIEAAAEPAGKPDMDAAARGAVESGAGGKERKAESAKPAAAAAGRGGGNGLAWLGGGVIGGLVALLIAGGLQWAGVVPPVRGAADVDLSPLQSQIDALAGKVTALESAPVALPDDVTAGLDVVRATADANASALAKLQDEVGALGSRVADLSETVSAGGAGDGAGLETLSGRVGAVETQLSGLAAKVAAAESAGPGVDPAALESIRAGIAGANEAVAGLRSDLAALGERVTAVEGEIESGAGSRVAAAVAASALKSAADRGGGFMSELEAYAAVSPDPQTVAALREYAAAGVPTVAKLVERFPAVANRIVAASQGVGEDAGIGARLLASARSLVQIRPVGEVEGDEPGAIAARIEVALTEGNLDGAIAEWDKLPEAARKASADFAADLKARRALDALIGKVLAGTMETGAPDAGQ
ncbi:MAG: hypothetical protein Kow0026_13970 [Oricola sp.]